MRPRKMEDISHQLSPTPLAWKRWPGGFATPRPQKEGKSETQRLPQFIAAQHLRASQIAAAKNKSDACVAKPQ